MSIDDVECPYCSAWNEVCHDDGMGYAEDELHEMSCESCEKVFVFETTVSLHYEGSQADCLNGEPHQLARSHTTPMMYTRMKCDDCDYSRLLARDEWLEWLGTPEWIKIINEEMEKQNAKSRSETKE